ncbi:MAG: hypothetical protein KAH01_07460 [Caldisericia bacterium]|nr:hypothetical protein [Caldisericia bacterium]
MGLNKELRSDLLKFLKDVRNEHPSKTIKCEDSMGKFFIDEMTLKGNLKFLVDLEYIRLLSNYCNKKALIRITDKGYGKI